MRRSLILLLLPLSATANISKAPNIAITAGFAADSPLAVAQGWNLTSYHISPCYDYAVFTSNPGRTFYANGTSDQFASNTSNVLSDGGTPPWPWGTIISAANATDAQGRRNVYINCAIGTPGVRIEPSSSFESQASPRLVYEEGEFYACNSTLLYGPAITLYYRSPEEGAVPDGCSHVDLLTRCLDDDSHHEYQRDSLCRRFSE